MILVIGGRGRSGKPVVDHLLSLGESVKMLTRNPSHPIIIDFIQSGVQIIHGDIHDQNKTNDIFSQVDRVYYISSSEYGICEEITAAKNFIDQAKQRNIKHFIFQSVMFSDTQLPHCAVKGIIDDYLSNSGLPYSILSPGIFFETIYNPLKSIFEQIVSLPQDSPARLVLSIPLKAELPWTFLDDIGKVASKLLVESGPTFKTVSVFSNPLVSVEEIAEFLTSILKKTVLAKHEVIQNSDFASMLIGKDSKCIPASNLLADPMGHYYSPIENWEYAPSKYESADRFGIECANVEDVLVHYLKLCRSEIRRT